ncbi:TM1266 family iron-only hydrogenase system putative regulator [Solidesulfovibrio sp. C21]|uniref:TM1266 family iron-only hydrogenase system putative regulator n=1 Tax=Solidesulfovibrio sp. C21 TaxID=3398613 RepID=UPI0039FC169C
MNRRIGVVGIVIEDPKEVSEKVNAVISDHGHLILGRMGIPKPEYQVGVISLIIEGTTDEIGSLTGRLGNLPGVTVKSALTTKTLHKEQDHD